MSEQATDPGRRRSRVGLAGSLTIHALFVACVWLVAGTSPPDDLVVSASTHMVQLVPGERAVTAARPSGVPRARLASTAPRAARAASPPSVATVSENPPPGEPVPSAAPEPEQVSSSGPALLSSAAPEPELLSSAGPEPVSSVALEPDLLSSAALVVTPAAVEPSAEAPSLAAVEPSAPGDHARLQAVTADFTVAARAQAEPFVARREVFEFLLDNLEFATHVTRALRVARYRVWRGDEGLVLDDGGGARLHLALVQASNGARVIYGRGRYRHTLLPEIHGEAVMKIEYATTPAEGGRDVVSAAVTGYVKLESGFLALLARMASAAVSDKAEREARRLVGTFARVSQAIEENPAKVLDEVRRSPDVPQAELEAFRKLLRIP